VRKQRTFAESDEAPTRKVGGPQPGLPPSFIPRGNFLLGGSGCPERYGQFGHIPAGVNPPDGTFWTLSVLGWPRTATSGSYRCPSVLVTDGHTLSYKERPLSAGAGPPCAAAEVLVLGAPLVPGFPAPGPHARSRTKRDLASRAEGGRPELRLGLLPSSLSSPPGQPLAGGSILTPEVRSFFPNWSRNNAETANGLAA
jgi:hypothetical protein